MKRLFEPRITERIPAAAASAWREGLPSHRRRYDSPGGGSLPVLRGPGDRSQASLDESTVALSSRTAISSGNASIAACRERAGVSRRARRAERSWCAGCARGGLPFISDCPTGSSAALIADLLPPALHAHSGEKLSFL